LVAVDPVPPHDPLVCTTPPRVRVAAEEVDPLAISATAVPLIERLRLIVTPPIPIVLFPEPDNLRLLYVTSFTVWPAPV
jgi:hypothetical protein